MWFPFFETGLEQPTGRFWQTDRRERTNMHHRVDAITTASYPFAHQQTTHASKPHLNLRIPPFWSQRPRHGLSFLLYSPAHDGGHIKWPPVRAELAINLSRCPRSPGACGYLVVACGSLFGTRLIFSRCKALLVLMGLGRLSFEGRFSRAGREVVLPCGFESLRLLTRKASRSAMRSRGWFLWLGRRDSNPQQPAPKTGVLPLNYVPMCGVAQKQLV